MKKNKLISFLISLSMVFFIASCGMSDLNTDALYSEKTSGHKGFEVHFIDVGQGDSALIRCDDEVMLIDGGKPGASNVIYTYLKKQEIDVIDYIVCTHGDDDHVGGLSAPLSQMTVKNVLAPATESDTRAYVSMKEKTAAQGLEIQHPNPGDEFSLADSTVEIFGPISESEEDRNNGSIVLKITYGENSFLFTGDAEREEEEEIIESGFSLKADVLKVGHHGSKNSTTYPFLREVMPQYAVISVGGDNSYGHPTEETLSRLRDAQAEVFRTDIQGDIVFKSDGKNITVTTGKNRNAVTNPTKGSLEYVEKTNESSKLDESIKKEETLSQYIANKNTKKLHMSSCRSVSNMKEENKIILNCTVEEAIKNGYTPCAKCKPY